MLGEGASGSLLLSFIASLLRLFIGFLDIMINQGKKRDKSSDHEQLDSFVHV